MIENGFNRIEHTQYKNRVQKKMGFAATGTTMGTIFDAGVKKANTVQKTENPQTYTKKPQELSLEFLGSHVSGEVEEAWFAAAEKTGVNNFQNTDTHLSALFAMQAEQSMKTGSNDILGATKESAKTAIKKAMTRLDNMMATEKVNTKIQEYRSKEMKFYEQMLVELG